MKRLLEMAKSATALTTLVMLARIGSGVIITPFLIHHCGSDELAIWYILLSLSSVALYFELGLAQNISRFVTQAWAGANEVLQEGLTIRVGQEPNFRLIAELSWVSFLFSLVLAIAAGVVLLICGLLFAPADNSFWAQNGRSILVLQSINVAISVWARSPIGVLQGMIKLRTSAWIQLAAVFSQLTTAILFIYYGSGVKGVVLAQLVSNFLLILVGNYAVYKILPTIRVSISNLRENLSIIWPSTLKMGLSGLAGNLMSQSVILLSAKHTSDALMASFGVMHQLVGVLFGISALPFQVLTPRLTELKIKSAERDFINLGASLVVWSVLFFTTLAVVLVIALHWLIPVLNYQYTALPWTLALGYVAVRALELHHCFYTMLIISRNTVPFVALSICTCVAIYLVSWIAGQVATLPVVLGIYASVQLLTNNWMPPHVFLRDSQLSFLNFLRIGIRGLKLLIGLLVRL